MSLTLRSAIFVLCAALTALTGSSQNSHVPTLSPTINSADAARLDSLTAVNNSLTSYTAEPPYTSIGVSASTRSVTGFQGYEYGHFVTHSRYSLPSGTPNAFVSTTFGQEQLQLVFTQHDAATVQLLYSAANSTGHVLVTGRARKNTGYLTQFIAGQNLDTTHPQILHTGRFLALAACQAPDTSLWGVGNFMPASASSTAFSLQHFTFKGAKLGSYTPSGKLRTSRLPLSQTESQLYLACLGNNVVLYDGYNSQIIEYLAYSHSIVTIPIPEGNTAGRIANGFAMDSRGTLYASWKRRSSRSSAALMALNYLDSKTPQWVAVDTTALRANSMNIVQLLGVENNALVVLLRGMYTPTRSVVWSQVTPGNSSPPPASP